MTKPLAETAIQQLNLGYDAQQDRLLLRVGLSDNTEITVWLTRKIVKTLWMLLQDTDNIPMLAAHIPSPDISAPLTRAATAELTEQSPAAPLNFADAYQPGRKARMPKPLLAIDCQIITLSHKKSTLELQTKEGNVVNIALSSELVQALGSMLQLALREAAWDLYLSSSQLIMSDTVSHPVLH